MIRYGDYFWLGVIFLSVLLIIMLIFNVIQPLINKIPGKKIIRFKPNKDRVINKKELFPLVLGGMLGFTVLSQYPIFAVAGIIFGAFLGRLGFKGYNWFYQKLTDEKKISEVLMLYEVISIYANAGYSLYEALNASLYLANLTRKGLQICLRNWGAGPQRALKKISEELNSPEADTLVRILQRAVVVGPSKLSRFLEQENEVMEKIREYKVEQGLGVRPIILTLYLILPGLALMGVTAFPVGYHIAKMISGIKLN